MIALLSLTLGLGASEASDAPEGAAAGSAPSNQATEILSQTPEAAASAQPSPAPPYSELTPIDVGENWRAFEVEKFELPTDRAALIKYLSQGYVPAEAELTLDEAIALALEHNHDLNSKRLQAMAACEGTHVNWANLRPQVSILGKAYWQRSNASATTLSIPLPDGTTKQVSIGGTEDSMISSLAISLTQRIYDFGQTKLQTDAALAQHAIRSYTVDMAEQKLVNDVTTAYYNFNLALGAVRIRRDEAALAGEFLRQARIQYDVGTVPRLDVVRAEARVAQANEALISARSTLGDASAMFFSLLGVTDERRIPAVLTAELIDPGAEPPGVQEAVDSALDYRPEVELQYATLLAGETKVDLARNRPTIEAYANALYQEPATMGGTDNYEYGVQLRWNVYNGGKDRAERRQAQLEAKALVEGIHDLEAKVELDATTSWNRLTAAREAVGAAKKNLELSGEGLRAAAIGYGAGVTPYIDFENALDQNVAAALGYLFSLVEVKLAQANLERAEGFPSGYPGDPRPARGEEPPSLSPTPPAPAAE
jgi:outer membrane protein TolC